MPEGKERKKNKSKTEHVDSNVRRGKCIWGICDGVRVGNQRLFKCKIEGNTCLRRDPTRTSTLRPRTIISLGHLGLRQKQIARDCQDKTSVVPGQEKQFVQLSPGMNRNIARYAQMIDA